MAKVRVLLEVEYNTDIEEARDGLEREVRFSIERGLLTNGAPHVEVLQYDMEVVIRDE